MTCLEIICSALAEVGQLPIKFFENESSALERGLLAFLLVLLAAIILFNVVHYVRVLGARKQDEWQDFFTIAARRKLNNHDINMLLDFTKENAVHPSKRIFRDSRLFDACATREVAKVKASPISYVAKKIRTYQITVLRRKLGFDHAPFGRYLENTREISTAQAVSVQFNHNGEDHIFRASVIIVDDLEIVLPKPAELEGRGVFHVGMPVMVRFIHPGRAKYEFASKVQQVSSFRIHLEHADELKRVQQRKFVRAGVGGLVTFEINGTPHGEKPSKKLSGQITDISAGGMGFSFDKAIPDGTEILLWMNFGGEDVFAGYRGTVLHSYSVGEGDEEYFQNHVQFQSMSENEKDRMIKFIFKQHYSQKK